MRSYLNKVIEINLFPTISTARRISPVLMTLVYNIFSKYLIRFSYRFELIKSITSVMSYWQPILSTLRRIGPSINLSSFHKLPISYLTIFLMSDTVSSISDTSYLYIHPIPTSDTLYLLKNRGKGDKRVSYYFLLRFI